MYTDVSGGLPAGQPRGIPVSNPLDRGGGGCINIIQLRKQRAKQNIIESSENMGFVRASEV